MPRRLRIGRPRTRAHALWLGLAVVVMWAASACAPDAPPSPAPPANPHLAPPVPSQLSIERFGAVRYEIHTDWLGATAAADGDGYDFVTDLGYAVHVDGAEVGLGAVELVPCAIASSIPASILRWVSPIGVARAVHGDEPDATSAILTTVDDLLAGQVTEGGPTPASGATYCEIHVLMVPLADENGLGVSGDVRGTYVSPDDDAPQRLIGRVNVRNGGSVVLEGAPEERVSGATVRLTRYPARALDGLRLEQYSSIELGFEFVGGVVRTARTHVKTH